MALFHKHRWVVLAGVLALSIRPACGADDGSHAAIRVGSPHDHEVG
jgi:hypothetical protein